MDLNVGMQAVVFFQAKEDVQMVLVLEMILFVLEYVEMEFLQLGNNVIREYLILVVAHPTANLVRMGTLAELRGNRL